MVPRHDRAADIDAEWWVWHIMIMRGRMAAAKQCRKEPEKNDPKARVKA
jgi:hypothetical protein